MTQSLQGKVAIVTGAASGIGADTAARLARDGAAVVVADIDLAKAEKHAAGLVQAGGNAAAVRVDLGDGRRLHRQAHRRLPGERPSQRLEC